VDDASAAGDGRFPDEWVRELAEVEAGLDKKLVKLARWLGTKVLRLD
jgi:hypothetical protein